MPLRSDPLDELAIPDGTTVEEHDLVTDGDVIVGGQSSVEFGIRGHNVIGGERVRFGGDIEAEADCRLDMWSDVAGNVLVGRDAYLGERVHIGGQLMVSGDLDIGDDVDIEDGFEANGWIVIRNPMPTIVFLFVYLSQLLRIGEEEAAAEIMAQLTDEDDTGHDPVVIPRNSRVNDDAWRVSTPATIGDDCRLHGNVRADSLTVGADNEIFGSLRAREDIAIGPGTEITGNVTTRNGTVRVARDARVRGDISADDVELHEAAVVEGSIRARGEMTMVRDETVTPPGGSRDDGTPIDDAVDGSNVAPTDETTSGDEEPIDEEPTSGDETTDEETSTDDETSDEDPTEPTAADAAAGDDESGDEGIEASTAADADPGTERVTADGSDPDSDPDPDPDDRRENGAHEEADALELP